MGLFSREPLVLPERRDLHEAIGVLHDKDQRRLTSHLTGRLLGEALVSQKLAESPIAAIIPASVGDGSGLMIGVLFVLPEDLLFWGEGGEHRIPLKSIYDLGLHPRSERLLLSYGNKEVYFALLSNKRDSQAAFMQRLGGTWETARRAAEAESTAAAPSEADELKKFAELREQGVLSDVEFEAKKAQILGL